MIEDQDDTEQLKDRSFNPWRIPKTDKCKAIIAEAVGRL